MSSSPLVLTLVLEASTQELFERQRAALFPAGRTQVGAHVTLFHALPAALREEVEAELAALSGVRRPEVEVAGLRPLGRGVAYELRSPWVAQQHAAWQRRWSEHLTRQDAAGRRLHVTVQNKVTAEVAARTLADLQQGFAPWRTTAIGCRLWRYDGGPWTLLTDASFAPPRD